MKKFQSSTEVDQVLIDNVKKTTHLSDTAKQHIIQWLTESKYQHYLNEVTDLIRSSSWHILEDNFFRIIPFGTGGRRGIVAVGSNRINLVTIGESCQALCDYLSELHSDKEDKLIAIAYDSRNTSVEFSEYAAGVFAANGFTAALYDNVRSTPQLSYTVRALNALAGIVISASHNPSSDNGIKIYWSDGGQVVAPHDYELLKRCEAVATIQSIEYKQGIASGSIKLLGAAQDNLYWEAVLRQSLHTQARSAKIAFSPLHGAGLSSVYPVLQKAGFNVELLREQATYDGNFTNVTNHIPNPEVPAANDKVSKYAISKGCDIAITNDPDADRLGVVVVNESKSTLLNGNQTAALLCEYILNSLKKQNKISSEQFIAKTIVTTDMLDAIAKRYGVKLIGNLLVGFKYIGEQIHLLCDHNNNDFVFGGEESYGALVGSYCRDKDAAGASLLIAEYASILKDQGKTLFQELDALYLKYGYFHEELHSVMFEGAEGFITMKKFMHTLRNQPFKKIAEQSVLKVRDYIDGEEIEGKQEDVLRFELSDDGRNRVTIRPSGTEPKLKIYIQLYRETHPDLQTTKDSVGNLAVKIKNELLRLTSNTP